MAYSGYANKINSSVTNLRSKGEGIKGISFDGSWKGSAKDKQVSHRDELDSNLNNVIGDMESLVKALQELDQYDTYKAQEAKWQAEVNSLDYDDERRANAIQNLSGARSRKAEAKESINNTLSAISTSYSSSLSPINKTALVPTNDIFLEAFKTKDGIVSSLDVSQYVQVHNSFTDNPNFSNLDAWVNLNPYTQAGFCGQCTWFSWGKFYEVYGYDPGFRGNGNVCASQLVANHPDKFQLSKTPVSGSVFSYKGYPYGHTGFVTEVKDGMMTIQDGNYNGTSDSFAVAQNDWGTRTVSVQSFINKYGGNVEFAVPV